KNDLAASLGALVFAIHPIHIEAVSWVSAANELFYTIFVLGSLLLLQESRDDSWDKKSYGALILWAAALFLKETAVVLLAVFAFLTWAKLETLKETGHCGKVAALRSIPWIVAAGIYLGLRTIVLQRSGLESGKQSWGEALLSAPGLVEFYLRKLVLPWHLSSFYYEDLTTNPGIRMWVAVLLIVSLILVLVWAAHKGHGSIALSGALVALPLLPVLGGLRIYERGSIAHDRYLYLPSAGLCLFVGIVVDKFSTKVLRQKSLSTGIGTIIACASIYLCLSQQLWYMNDRAYYYRAVELYPQNFLVWEFWGRFDLTHKNPKEGLEELTRAHQLAPENPNVDYYYARALFENGRYVEAEPLLEQLSNRSEQKKGRREILLLALGQTEMRLGRFLESENTLNRLSQMDSAFPGLHNTFGNLYQLEGKLGVASAEFMKEFELTGDFRSKKQAIALGAR
ncbi:MAG TPA: tetratricopeptide repeat protein, partial [Nitrososphaera sp.]|nr:tetratricopeptide repeat protein [Nitrososphaera sp.]